MRLTASLTAAALIIVLLLPLLWRRKRLKRRTKSHKRSSRGNQYDYRKHLDALKEACNGCCALCGMPIDFTLPFPHPGSLSIDHIIPMAKGGSHDISNLQLTHLRCNLRKGGGSKRKRYRKPAARRRR